MSLDVYLILPGGAGMYESGIFVRENGETKEISRAEWDEKFPGREPVVAMSAESDEVFTANITHNLTKMADTAGLYDVLWRPEEHGITKASQLVSLLATGLETLLRDPEKFRVLNPENGWGNYDGLVRFVTNYLAACQEYPDATVRVSR